MYIYIYDANVYVCICVCVNVCMHACINIIFMYVCLYKQYLCMYLLAHCHPSFFYRCNISTCQSSH